jgi:arabinofuranan 3-O-arabinosyltransferase
VVPAGTSGPIILTFPSNAAYRVGLFGGLALLPILALLALLPVRRPRAGAPARPWQPGPVVVGAAALAAGTVISGVPGAVVVAAAFGVRHLLRHRPRLQESVTVGTCAAGLIAAGAALSRYPWRSVDGYVGHSPWVQLLALTAVAMLAASTAVYTSSTRRGVSERDTQVNIED